MIGTLFVLSGNAWLTALAAVFTVVAAIGALSVQLGSRP